MPQEKGILVARLADQIRDYVAIWSHQDLPGYLFSFTQVTVTPDRSKAILWYEIANPDQMGTISRKLIDHLPHYQRRLGKELGKRSCPRLSLAPDPAMGYSPEIR